MLLSARRVVTPERTLLPGWLDVSGAMIRLVGEGTPPSTPDYDLGDAVITPGFVDIHCHGGGGASFMDGPDAARVVRNTHLDHGTTTIVASLVTDRIDRLVRVCSSLAPLAATGELAGIHLEGPWLSQLQCGAHDPSLLRTPHLEDVQRLEDACAGTLAMVTIAPELPLAADVIRHLCDMGVVAALGHSQATYDEARAGLLAGASVATHVYNGMRPMHHREPGIAGAVIGDEQVFVEMIADGVHLHPAVLATLMRFTRHRSVLVTDAMAAAGAGDGSYRLGPMAVTVEDGVARLRSGAIAGSTLTLDAAVRFAVNRAGVELDDAVRSATLTPASVIGRTDLGRITPGLTADLTVLTPDLHVRGVMHRGHWRIEPS